MATKMLCLEDFEKYAVDNLARDVLDYYSHGADGNVTLSDNIQSFKRWRLLPRVLRDVSECNTQTTILGHPVSFPVCVAPTAMHRMAHPDGEVATVKASAAMDTAYTLSTASSTSIEEVAAQAPDSLRFFQLYIYRERSITTRLIKRAEESGFKALILTVDTPVFGKQMADKWEKVIPSKNFRMANFEKIDLQSSGIDVDEETGSGEYDPTLTWEDIAWVKSLSRIPLILKGILTAEDACLAVEHGVDGIVVSNHGARLLDTVPATIDVLSSIVRAVAGRCEVYLDGGVRCGTDVLKALALGAQAVFVGRPILYGLAYNGEAGVKQLLQILKDEFSTAMALSGCSSVEDIKRELVIHQSQYLSKL